MQPSCHACSLGMVAIGKGVFVCRRCDTTAQGNGMRVGPPTLPGTRDGWFNAPFGDTK
jgi:tRNA(Ile2) C34 agmatinyltransferase TiaS